MSAVYVAVNSRGRVQAVFDSLEAALRRNNDEHLWLEKDVETGEGVYMLGRSDQASPWQLYRREISE